MPAPSTPSARRSIVYVDGFNLYYGALKGQNGHRWLDLATLFTRLRPDEALQHVHYFTARAGGADKEPQSAYLEALETTPLVEVHLGNFKRREIRCRVQACGHTGNRHFGKYEEKHTDVNIALRMLDDAHQDLCDQLVLVTGDSDLVPAIELVKRRFPEKGVAVYVPVNGDSSTRAKNARRNKVRQLSQVSDSAKPLPPEMIRGSQFPATLTHETETIQRPAGW